MCAIARVHSTHTHTHSYGNGKNKPFFVNICIRLNYLVRLYVCLLSYRSNGDEQRPKNHNENEMNINHNHQCARENDISAANVHFPARNDNKRARLNRLLRVFCSSGISANNEVQRSLICVRAHSFLKAIAYFSSSFHFHFDFVDILCMHKRL